MRKGWERLEIKEVGTVVTGGTPSTLDPSYYNGEYPFVSPADINDGIRVSETEKTLTEAGILKVRPIPSGSTLFTCIGYIGKTALAHTRLATNQQINSVVPDLNVADPTFLYYVLSYRAKYIKCMASIQTLPIINKTTFESVVLEVPPLAEQRKIAAILRTWDQAIEQYDLLIKKCERRREAIAIRIYGEIQRQASLSPMNKVCEFIRNGIVYQPAAEGDRKFQVTRIETISFGIIDFARTGFAQEGTKNIDRYKLEAGDILFSHINSIDHIGKTAIFEGGDLYHGMNLLCFRANRSIVHPRYLYNFLMLRSVRNYFMRKARPAVAQVSLNISDINECQIPVPSLEVQNNIVAKLGCYDLEISFLKKSRELTIQQKRGLMQKLLTGEWRVAVDVQADSKEMAHA